jgi:hypothetical protein
MRTLYVVGLMAGIDLRTCCKYTAKCRRDHLGLVNAIDLWGKYPQ